MQLLSDGCSCCHTQTGSIRYRILMLSFLVAGSLFANMMLYSIVVVYYDVYHSQTFNDEMNSISKFKTTELTEDSPSLKTEHDNLEKKRTTIKIKDSSVLNKSTYNDPVENFKQRYKKNVSKINSKDNSKLKFDEKIENANKNGLNTFIFKAKNFDNNRHNSNSRERFESLKSNQDLNDRTTLPSHFQRHYLFNLAIPSSAPLSIQLHNDIGRTMEFAAPGFGALIAYAPSRALADTIGIKRVVGGVLILSTIFTSTFPILLFRYETLAAIPVRFLLGACFAPSFLIISEVIVRWPSISERSFFLTICFIAFPFSLILSWHAALFFITRQSIALYFTIHPFFYIFGLHAIVCAILFFIWIIFFVDVPQKHRTIGGIELNKIMTGRTQLAEKPARRKVIFTSTSIWVAWVTAFGYFFPFAILSHFLPIFLYRFMRETLDSNVTIPMKFLIVVHLATYFLNRFLPTTTVKARISNTIAFALTTIIFVALAVFVTQHEHNSTQKQSIILLLSLSIAPLGLAGSGLFDSLVSLISRHNNDCAEWRLDVLRHIQLSFSVALLLTPIGVHFFIMDGSTRHWRLVFISTAGVLAMTSAVFAVLGHTHTISYANETTFKQHILTPISNACDECGIIEMREIDPNPYVENNSKKSVLEPLTIR